MKRLVPILLIALIAGPQLGYVLAPDRDVCAEERQDCCGPEDACGASCVVCGCCDARPLGFPGPGLTVDFDRPLVPTSVASVAIPSSAPPSDILHIPKSA